MREIQDLTLQRARGDEGLDALFAKRQRDFSDWIISAATQQKIVIGARITLIPTADLFAKDVFRNNDLFPPAIRDFEIAAKSTEKAESAGKIEALFSWDITRERPIVRGSCRSDYSTPTLGEVELHCNGLVEVRFREQSTNLTDARIFPGWILAAACNGFYYADTFRRGVGAPDVEYAYEIEIAATISTIPIQGFPRHGQSLRMSDTLPSTPLLFPRMSFGLVSEIPALVEILCRDLCNSCGIPFNYKVTAVESR